jgi:hypothetical protein
LAVGFVPAATVADVVGAGLGPFATPYQSTATTYVTQVAPERFQSRVTPFEREVDGLPENFLVGVFYTSAVAGGLIMMTGHEFLPIGGFTGGAPIPTLGRIEQQANDGEIRLAYVPLDATDDPRVAWIVDHCGKVGQPRELSGVVFQNFRCLPSS